MGGQDLLCGVLANEDHQSRGCKRTQQDYKGMPAGYMRLRLIVDYRCLAGYMRLL